VNTTDIGKSGVLRTGGDKWIRPIYANILEGIITAANKGAPENWLINDISKLNGGKFEGHKTTHHIGIDVDLLLMGRGFKLNTKRTLNALERLLKGSKDYNGYITDYIITVPGYYKPNTKERAYSSLVEKRFQNRCIGDRIIRLPKERGTGSVLRHIEENHSDHTHLRFNWVAPNAPPNNRVKQLPQDVSIEDFDFRYNSEGELVVKFRNGMMSKYADKRVLWRYQDQESFDDLNLNVSFGEVLEESEVVAPESLSKHNQLGIRYIYLAIENKNGSQGWCVEKKAVIEI